MFEAYTLGLLLGLRHALEPDHLAAVSTLVAERRSRLSSWLGLSWGAGHALALLIVAGGLALVEKEMPAKISAAFELGVSAMLVGLGIRAIAKALKEGGQGANVPHRHGDMFHRHPGAAHHVHWGRRTFAARSLWIGLIHGLAGSGAMTALVMARIPSASARLVYIALFGVGSTAGMTLLTGLAGARLEHVSRHRRVPELLLGISGSFSFLLGIYWAAASFQQLALR